MQYQQALPPPPGHAQAGHGPPGHPHPAQGPPPPGHASVGHPAHSGHALSQGHAPFAPGPPPPRYANYAPHTALPQVNSGAMFEYPSSGVNGGLHSAPPVMNSYSQPLPPSYAQAPPQSAPPPAAFAPRPPPTDFADVAGSGQYGFNSGMDSFIESAIDEMAHNPLAYIGGGE